MELKLVVFLAFTSVALVVNTLLIWFAYKAFAGVVTRVSETATDFGKSRETVAVVNSVKVAAEQARKATEITKEKLLAFEPVLERASRSWSTGIAKIDAKFESLEQKAAASGKKIRDAVAKPAYKISAVATGIHSVLGFLSPGDDES